MRYQSFSNANSEQISAIVQLRQLEYVRRFGSDFNLQYLNWNDGDQNSQHFCAYNQNQLISTLRVSVHLTAESLERSTRIKTPLDLQYPVGLLARAATRANFTSLGVHTHLRSMAFNFLLSHSICTILGTLEVSALRLPQLLDLGYRVLTESSAWKASFLKSQGPVALIGLIGQKEILKALEKMASRNLPTNQHISLE